MKLNKKKIFTLFGLTAIILVIFLYIIFSENTICKEIEVNFEANSSERLIEKEDIEKLVFAEYNNLIGSPIKQVDLSLLESIIEKHPTVKNAEVYKKIDGILVVDIENRIPIVRIIPENGPGFYLDSEGEFMPTSRSAGARVLVANGYFSFEYSFKQLTINDDSLITNTLKDIYNLALNISEDSFLKAQTEQIYVTKDGEYEIIPKVGKHKVLLGDIYNYEKKLQYLKHFYINVLKTEGWRKYNYINLKYKGQIVCTLNE